LFEITNAIIFKNPDVFFICWHRSFSWVLRVFCVEGCNFLLVGSCNNMLHHYLLGIEVELAVVDIVVVCSNCHNHRDYNLGNIAVLERRMEEQVEGSMVGMLWMGSF